MALRKEDTVNCKRKHCIAFCAESLWKRLRACRNADHAENEFSIINTVQSSNLSLRSLNFQHKWTSLLYNRHNLYRISTFRSWYRRIDIPIVRVFVRYYLRLSTALLTRSWAKKVIFHGSLNSDLDAGKESTLNPVTKPTDKLHSKQTLHLQLCGISLHSVCDSLW
jgi:hypothetical protein